MPKKVLMLMVVCFVLLVVMGAVNADVRYTVVDLGIYQRPVSINNIGQVVGFSMTSDHQPFLWQDDALIELPVLNDAICGPECINDSGKIVGIARMSDDTRQAISWENGILRTMDIAGLPTAINNFGKIAGGDNQPALWQNDAKSSLGTLGGAKGIALGINDYSQVVGFADTASTYQDSLGEWHPYRHAFLWDSGTIQDIGTNGGMESFAVAINNSSQIVGVSLANNRSNAFLWDNDEMVGLSTLGGRFSGAKDINIAGQVVGISEDAEGKMHASLWEERSISDLNSLIDPESGWALQNAVGINDSGQIIGIGVKEHELHGFLLNPVAE